MGLFDFIRRGAQQPPAETKPKRIDVVGARATEQEMKEFTTFSNSNITFSGELSGYDYDSILRDKQNHIVDLYKLSDYYTDEDPLIRGIIRHVYVPYTLSSPWVLSGATEKTRKIYEDFYDRIRLREKLNSIVLEYWKYSNVFVYIRNGIPITLPVHKCKIGNVALNGEPIVDFDCQSIYHEWRQKNYAVRENWIKDNDLEVYFKGYPPEVQEALNKGAQYAQLNPKYTKVLQGDKEGWHRYSIPFIAACLSALAKKELINKYEDAVLNLAIHGFVHVKYGDDKKGADILPDINQLREVRTIFSKAMNGFPLAVTNQLAKAEVVQPELDDLFQFDKYKDVNNSILSAGGISGIMVSGLSEDGSTFASAQVSERTAAVRIEAARDEICELMNKINVCIKEQLEETHVYNVKNVPVFGFMPLDMAGRKALRDTCKELWQQGLVSTDTLMMTHGYSLERERAKRETEAANGTDWVMLPRDQMNTAGTSENTSDIETPGEEAKVGRPTMTDEERTSDPDAALRGKQPKPSNPEGSMDDS